MPHTAVQSLLSNQNKTINHTLALRRGALLSSFVLASQNAHWVGKWHGGQLCTMASSLFPTSKADMKNLKKFVLDALNGIPYGDDGQVASVCKTKVLYNSGTCEIAPLS